jgi:hypothetical protein
MLNDGDRRRAGIRRRGLVVAAMALAVPLMALGSVSSALAAPVFEKFKECPTEIPGATLCQWAQTTSGEFAIGTTEVPINMPVTQQGGGIPDGIPTEYFLLPAKNGESLSKTELNVPGGLLDLVNCTKIKGEFLFEKAERAFCKGFFENGFTGVTSTLELVANEHDPAFLNEHNLAEETGTAITLPVRIHLKNPLLGNVCYIGSEASPILLHLSTGKSGTLTGKRGKVQTLHEGEREALRIYENTLVDNTFTVPVTEGCGEFFGITGFLDSLVNEKLGLPSKAGNNIAKLEGELTNTSVEEVELSGF